MATGVLQGVTLSYQALWNAQREAAGVLLWLDAPPTSAAHTELLITALCERWPAQASDLWLSTPSPHWLTALLETAPAGRAQVLVSSDLLNDPAMAQTVQHARQRGLRVVWRGQAGQRALPAVAATFDHALVCLSAEDALQALRVSLRRLHNTDNPQGLHSASPVRPDQTYDGVASRVLADHCLDEQNASALLGWPMEDVLYGYRQTRLQPGRDVIQAILRAIDAEASMDEIEQHLGRDPLLAYRFLRFVNSAALGLPQDIGALRQGMMVLGLARTKSWLQDLLPLASQDLNLQPVRQTMELRARFMAQLLDAGGSDALQREMYLCGLLSQIDLLLFESMPSALRGIPLPTRVKEAVLSQTGPYWPYLAMAMALETPHLEAIRVCANTHGFDLHAVNLALINTLAGLRRPQ